MEQVGLGGVSGVEAYGDAVATLEQSTAATPVQAVVSQRSRRKAQLAEQQHQLEAVAQAESALVENYLRRNGDAPARAERLRRAQDDATAAAHELLAAQQAGVTLRKSSNAVVKELLATRIRVAAEKKTHADGALALARAARNHTLQRRGGQDEEAGCFEEAKAAHLAAEAAYERIRRQAAATPEGDEATEAAFQLVVVQWERMRRLKSTP